MRISALVCLLYLLAIPADATEIGSYAGASGAGLGLVTFGGFSSPALGNDDVAGASSNTVTITEKRFDTVEPIDMVYLINNSGFPAIEYQLTETVTNNSGTNWIGYQVRLGFGTDASFVDVALGTGFDLDYPDFNSPKTFGPFGAITDGEEVTNATGGPMLAGSTHTFTYAFDLPPGLNEITIRTDPREEPVANEDNSWGRVKALY